MRKKRTSTRRQKALRWLLLLCVMVFLMGVTGSYHVLPSQTIAYHEQRSGLAPTEIIHTEWGKYDPVKDEYFMVSQNEEYVLLSSAYFQPLRGWRNRGTAAILERGEEGSHHVWKVHPNDEKQIWVSLFGFVPDGEQAPTFRMGIWDWSKDIDEEDAFVGELVTVTPVPTIPVEGGMLFLEQYCFSMEAADHLEHKELAVHVWENGVWEDPHSWTVSSRS